MGIAERRAREREVLRSRILDAASELFVSEGVPNVSLRKIAEKIEYSPATIYLYFRDKDHLLSSLCMEVFSKLCEGLDEMERSSKDPVEAFLKGLRFYIEFGLSHPHHYTLTFSGAVPAPADGEHSVPEYLEANNAGLAAFDRLRRSLRRCADAGQLEFDDLEATAQTVWTFIHGTTSLLITMHPDPHFPWVAKEKIIDTAMEMILNGLRPQAASVDPALNRN
jgi:AcrR family transcriptional regulator